MPLLWLDDFHRPTGKHHRLIFARGKRSGDTVPEKPQKNATEERNTEDTELSRPETAASRRPFHD
jgi:hypothetical protein